MKPTEMEDVVDSDPEFNNDTRHIDHMDYSLPPGYQEGMMMWKVWPPFLIVLGSFGNIATVLVMRRIKNDNSSQSDILIALAIADLSVLYSGTIFDWIGDVFDIFVVDFHRVLCKFMMSVFHASHVVSAWLVVTVTVQRTMAVLWPHRMRMMCTVRRTRVVIAVVVGTVSALHTPRLIAFDLNKYKNCEVLPKYEHFMHVLNWINLCLACLLPSICLFVCDIILSWSLFKSTSISSTSVHGTSENNAVHSHDSRRKTAVKMTGMVLTLSLTFMLLTLPLSVHVIFCYIFNTCEKFMIVLSVASFLWDLNNGVNFVLYCLTGTRFRKEFLSMVRCKA